MGDVTVMEKRGMDLRMNEGRKEEEEEEEEEMMEDVPLEKDLGFLFSLFFSSFLLFSSSLQQWP